MSRPNRKPTRRQLVRISAADTTIRIALAFTLLVTLLGVAGEASAADETTTTTSLPEESTTTTTDPSTTTTTFPESTTTTQPGITTTTLPGDTTTTLPPGVLPTPIEPTVPPDTDIDEGDFVVGTRPAPPIVFPLAGDHFFHSTFGAPRDGGRRRHAGTDIFAKRGVPVLAVADGVVEEIDEAVLAGQYIVLRHDDGWRSKYLHLDNDTPGTDDGLAIGYAEGIEVGVWVPAGTVLGYVGDSGNAETTAPHLHFALHQPNGLPIDPYRALVRAPEVPPLYLRLIPSVLNTSMVGYLDPDRTGFNAGISVVGDHVFMGTWGNDRRCPGTGVRVIDVSNPRDPLRVAAFATADEFPGTATESIWVGAVETPDFTGEIAVVGVRHCDVDGWARSSGRFAGLAVYDVSDLLNPSLLTTVHSGGGTGGVQHIDVNTESGRVLVAASVPNSLLDDPLALGDVRFYDLSDPATAIRLSDWDFRRDAPLLEVEPLRARLGDDDLSAGDVTWLDPTRVVVAHPAAGLVTLDVADPTAPAFLDVASPYGTFDLVFGPEEIVGPQHSARNGRLHGGSVLVQTDEILEPRPGDDDDPGQWGGQILYDMSGPVGPRVLSTFGTENSRGGGDGEVGRDGYYSALESIAFGETHELVAWMSDGVRLVDLADPSAPQEVGFFVPPPRRDPQGWWVAPDRAQSFPLVWGVVSDGELVYVSDANSGLWIFRVTTGEAVPGRLTPK